MPEITRYEWRVVFRNSRMGFQKSYAVIAQDHTEAISEGYAELRARNYLSESFEVIELKRGRIA